MLFNLRIQGWRLTLADLAVSGTIHATAGAAISATRSWSTDRTWTLLRGQRLGAVTFMVGPVPFRIAGQLDIETFLRAQATGSLTFSAGVTATANSRVGITFRNGRWSTLHSRGWQHQRLAPTLRAGANAAGAVFLVPSITLIANWIGGPLISLAPFVAADVSARANTCAATVGWGMEVLVGARLDIQNPVTGNRLGCNGCSHVWRSQPVWSTGTRPLFTCPRCTQCRAG